MKAKVRRLPLKNGDLKIEGKIYKRAKYDGLENSPKKALALIG